MSEEITGRRVVTKGTKNGAFQVGDHITIHKDGSISCWEAQGWIEADEVAEATEGMEHAPDCITD